MQRTCRDILNQCLTSASTHPMPVRCCVALAELKRAGSHASHENAPSRSAKRLSWDLSASCRYGASLCAPLPLPALTKQSAQSTCPPREVRSFRVLLMRDSRTTRRPARRVVELTVWDVLSLAFDGAPTGHFKDGQRFQVSPTCQFDGSTRAEAGIPASLFLPFVRSRISSRRRRTRGWIATWRIHMCTSAPAKSHDGLNSRTQLPWHRLLIL